jgi:cob(I)alamin adenosyltransferase
MKIYTRGGDRGETGLLGGVRVSKDSLRPDVIGTVDELNAVLGVARCESLPPSIAAILDRIQHQLFDVGTELASPTEAVSAVRRIGAEDIGDLETAIDRHEETVSPLRTFILPGGSRAAALLHVARTVCRRMERRLTTLAHAEPEAVSADLAAYVNRLSDLLFVLARSANAAAGATDTPR